MYTAKEFKQQLDAIRQQVINKFTSTAKCFETYEAEGELDSSVKFSDGIDDQDGHYMANGVKLDGTIIVNYDFNDIEVAPEQCETEFLIDVLEQMEITLAKLHLEFA